MTRGTIHSLCVILLREHGERIGVPRGFGIADEGYQVQLLRRLGVPKDAWATLAAERLQPASPGRGGAASQQRAAAGRTIKAWLARRKLLDYDDLVLRAAELLDAFRRYGSAIAARWDAVLVDEMPGPEPGQYAVIKRLAEGHRNLFAVGDDEQSIFSWTGADPRVLRAAR